MTNLQTSISHLQSLIQARISQHLNGTQAGFKIAPLDLGKSDDSIFTQFITNYKLTTEETMVLLLGLIPHIYPGFIDNIIAQSLPKGGNLPEFGGVKGKNHRGTIPTGETALFLLAGKDLGRRFQIQQIFSSEHIFERQKIIYLEQMVAGEPDMSGRIILDSEYVELFLMGKMSLPRLSTTFPARHLSTEMEWNDLILPQHTATQIKELESWVTHNDTLLYEWGMIKKIKPGYRALFYGPPGTGKTLTATLLGKYTQKHVFRVDLSMVVSKYIGETEKNLSNLFDKAENKNWILFFDEADAIFGKRTNVRDAHDKYANQETAYLLQRIETYPGLTILASNQKSNIDDAFTRRFNSIIFFPAPKAEERLLLWQKSFPTQVILDKSIDLTILAQNYELTGSQIINIVQFACLKVLEDNNRSITEKDLLLAIQREFSKEGKIM